ncbi:hypothetical protein [Desulfonema limicola]|nr:hypothetical protein [Desulfonema limicola]
MADIISIDNKLKDVRQRKKALARQRKLAAIRSVFQEARRTFRCEKCYRQLDLPDIEEDDDEEPNPRVPYRFCESCSEEYIDYIEKLKGKGNPDCYWHNDAWRKTWHSWIDYQGAVDNYLKTSEFKQLIQELNEIDPDK